MPVAKRPTARPPHIPFTPCTENAPTGSSILSLISTNSTATTTRIPETIPMIAEPIASTSAQPAVTATRPASEALRHIETSGLPFLIQVKSIHVTVATAGAIVVVRRI